MFVYIGTLDDRENALLPQDAVLGCWDSLESATAAIERDEQPSIEQAGGFTVPDAPWEAEPGEHGTAAFALLGNGGSIVIRQFKVRGADDPNEPTWDTGE